MPKNRLSKIERLEFKLDEHLKEDLIGYLLGDASLPRRDWVAKIFSLALFFSLRAKR
jgi:hypothetical protein